MGLKGAEGTVPVLVSSRQARGASEQSHTVYVYYYRTYEKAVSGGGEREKGGHVLRDPTSRGLYVRVWPPHTSERRGGGGGCEQGSSSSTIVIKPVMMMTLKLISFFSLVW